MLDRGPLTGSGQNFRDVVAIDGTDFGLETENLAHASIALGIIPHDRPPSVAEQNFRAFFDVVRFHDFLAWVSFRFAYIIPGRARKANN